MFHFYRFKHGKAAKGAIESRAKTSLFDVEQLATEMPYYPAERVIDNNLYGYAQQLKEYANIQHDLKGYMEHGLFLGGIVHPDQHHWHFEKIITMSEARVAILKKTLPNKKPIAVGPYIHYAKPFLNKADFTKLKTELGRTLLVFPFHSMKGVEAGFEEKQLINRIKEVAKDFDSVLVSLYYLDAQKTERVEAYQKAGFKVVTAGHKFDPNFISRQRTHIELADITMSNGMGTQTGYCIYLKKPHYIFSQKVRQSANAAESKRHVGRTNDQVREKVEADRAFFSELFSRYSESISSEQYEATADFWGFDQVKSAEELQRLFG